MILNLLLGRLKWIFPLFFVSTVAIASFITYVKHVEREAKEDLKVQIQTQTNKDQENDANSINTQFGDNPVIDDIVNGLLPDEPAKAGVSDQLSSPEGYSTDADRQAKGNAEMVLQDGMRSLDNTGVGAKKAPLVPCFTEQVYLDTGEIISKEICENETTY